MIKEFFFPNDGKTEHFAALDGLRGFAVLLVLISHANLIGVYVPNILNYPQMGTCGVQLFFVLSAYLLDRQIANALLNQKADKRYWLNYTLRRFLRIYPMFFLSLLLYYFLTMHVKGNMGQYGFWTRYNHKRHNKTLITAKRRRILLVDTCRV